VLPGVMGLEGFVELATLLVPGWHVRAIEGVRFEAPFKFYRDEPRSLELSAQLLPEGDQVVAHCALRGSRQLPGRDEPALTTHFTARVRLAAEPQPAETATAPGSASPGAAGGEDVYGVYFHGPAYQVLERAWEEGGAAVGALAADLPVDHQPPELPLRAAPREIELCFQTAGIWEIGVTGRMGLPQQIDRVVFPGGLSEPSGPLYAVVTPHEGGARYDARVLDSEGAVRLRLEGYCTATLPGPVADDLRGPLRRAMEGS